MKAARRRPSAAAPHLVTAALLALGAMACAPAGGAGGDDPAGGSDGGDGGAPAEPDRCTSASGARLALMLIEAAGGGRVANGIYDLELETECEVAPYGDDGELRCLPTPTTSPGSIVYTDAACSQALFLPAAFPPLPSYHAQAGGASCAPAVYRRIGEPIDLAGGAPLFHLGDAGCAGFAAQANTYYPLGPPLPAAAFARLEPTSTSAGSRLDLRAWTSADGLRLCDGTIHDRDLAVDCTPAIAEDGELRCVPLHAAPSRVFTDGGCASPADVVVHRGTCGAPPPLRAGITDDGFCAPRTRVRRLDPPLARPVYQGDPGSCAAVFDDDDHAVFPLGATEASFGLEPLAVEYRDVGGRLAVAELVSPDGLSLPAAPLGDLHFLDPPYATAGNRFLDRELDVVCRFDTAVDGSVRCIPTGTAEEPVARVLHYHADPACTVPVQVGVAREACAGVTPRYAVGTTSLPLNAVYPVIGPAGDAPLYELAGGCAPVDGDGHLALGAEIVPAAMVAGEARVDGSP